MTEHDLKRFGRIVRKQREELGIQQEDLDQHGGPSSTTLSRIERGQSTPSPKTLRKLDLSLAWEPGSAKRTLEGGEPELMDYAEVSDRSMSALLLEGLVYITQALNVALAQNNVEQGATIIEAANQLMHLLDQKELQEPSGDESESTASLIENELTAENMGVEQPDERKQQG